MDFTLIDTKCVRLMFLYRVIIELPKLFMSIIVWLKQQGQPAITNSKNTRHGKQNRFTFNFIQGQQIIIRLFNNCFSARIWEVHLTRSTYWIGKLCWVECSEAKQILGGRTLLAARAQTARHAWLLQPVSSRHSWHLKHKWQSALPNL